MAVSREFQTGTTSTGSRLYGRVLSVSGVSREECARKFRNRLVGTKVFRGLGPSCSQGLGSHFSSVLGTLPVSLRIALAISRISDPYRRTDLHPTQSPHSANHAAGRRGIHSRSPRGLRCPNRCSIRSSSPGLS